MKRAVMVCLIVGSLSLNVGLAQDLDGHQALRRSPTTYSPLMEVLADSRNVVVTEAQLRELESLQIEAIWDSVGAYQGSYVGGFQSTQPGKQVAGRALTIHFLPARPDVREGLEQLAKEGDWDRHSYGRVADEARPGDVVVADLGGAAGDQMFGDIAGLGIMLAGVRGAVIDGGIRDQDELRAKKFANFPVYTRYFDIDTSKWLAAEWNVPVRIGQATVLPGDIVVANDSAALFFPPQLIDEVLSKARARVALENFQRKVLLEGHHRFQEVYPDLSPALRERYEREGGAK